MTTTPLSSSTLLMSSYWSTGEIVRHHGLEFSKVGENVLRWPKNDSGHPRNWSYRRKTFDTVILILLEIGTTMSSSSGVSLASMGLMD